MSDNESYSYAKAGVDIAAGNALVRAIAPLAKATRRPGADAELGGFGGFAVSFAILSGLAALAMLGRLFRSQGRGL